MGASRSWKLWDSIAGALYRPALESHVPPYLGLQWGGIRAWYRYMGEAGVAGTLP